MTEIKSLDQLLKDRQNGGGRVAGLYLSGKGMSEKLAVCLLLILLQGGVEDGLKVGRGRSIGVSLGHGSC